MNTFVLQTYYFGSNDIEQRGFSRDFSTLEEAEDYARENMCGSRHTITVVDTIMTCDKASLTH